MLSEHHYAEQSIASGVVVMRVVERVRAWIERRVEQEASQAS